MSMGIWSASAQGQAAGAGASRDRGAGTGAAGTNTPKTGGATAGTPKTGGTGATGAGATGTGSTGSSATGAGGAAAAPTVTVIPAVSAPVTVAQAAYTDPAGNRAVIVDFVMRNLQNLMNDTDPAVQTNARNNLSAATMTAGAPASPAFLFEYGMALNNAFLPKLDPKANATLRQRLNIAIVTARVAYVAENVTLQATTIKLMSDATEPVALWGIKAAQKQVPLILKSKTPGAKGAPPILTALDQAVFKHPSGPVFAEAYLALTAVDPLVYEELVKLWGNRLSQYQGKEAPDDPEVDGRPVFTLSTSEMWKAVINTPAAQAKVMQMISDQTSVAAQWADQTKGDKHDQLVKLVIQCAGACSVIGTNLKNSAIENAASTPSRLNFATMPADTPMQPKVADLIAAIKSAFPAVQAPPKVGPSAGVAQQP